MANGFLTPEEPEQNFLPLAEEEEEEELIQPSVIHILAAEYAEQQLPHDEAIAKLTTDFTEINWKDKDEAAKKEPETEEKKEDKQVEENSK